MITVTYTLIFLYMQYSVGETQESLSITFRLGRSTISGIIKEVTAAIMAVLKDDFLRVPQTEDEWRVVANDFGERWNFHNVIGAMDGKHCLIDPPLKSGSMFYSYKGSFSRAISFSGCSITIHLRRCGD